MAKRKKPAARGQRAVMLSLADLARWGRGHADVRVNRKMSVAWMGSRAIAAHDDFVVVEKRSLEALQVYAATTGALFEAVLDLAREAAEAADSAARALSRSGHLAKIKRREPVIAALKDSLANGTFATKYKTLAGFANQMKEHHALPLRAQEIIEKWIPLELKVRAKAAKRDARNSRIGGKPRKKRPREIPDSRQS